MHPRVLWEGSAKYRCAAGTRCSPRCCVLSRARTLQVRTLPASLPRNDHHAPATSDVPPSPLVAAVVVLDRRQLVEVALDARGELVGLAAEKPQLRLPTGALALAASLP